MIPKQLDRTEYAKHLKEVGLSEDEILKVLAGLNDKGVF